MLDISGTVRSLIVCAILALVAGCGCVGLGWWVNSLRADNKRLGEANAALTVDLAEAKRLRKIDQAVASRYAESVAKLTTTQKATDAKLRTALAAEAPWRDAAVPAGVLDALRVPSTTPSK